MDVVGVVGLGRMGTGIAETLLGKGYEVHVYNRTKDRALALAARGAVPHETPGDLGARVDVAITMLTDHAAVESVAFGDHGLLAAMKEGARWIDMSTIDPDASVRHAEEARRRGIRRLDAPVMAGPRVVAAGEAVIFVGGDRQTYEESLQVFRALGKEIAFLGGPGSGHRMKLAMNLYLALTNLAYAEALAFAEKQGIARTAFAETLNRTLLASGWTRGKGVSAAKGTFEPTFSLALMRKDLLLADAQARRHGLSLPMTATAKAAYESAGDLDALDYSAMALFVQRQNELAAGSR